MQATNATTIHGSHHSGVIIISGGPAAVAGWLVGLSALGLGPLESGGGSINLLDIHREH